MRRSQIWMQLNKASGLQNICQNIPSNLGAPSVSVTHGFRGKVKANKGDEDCDDERRVKEWSK